MLGFMRKHARSTMIKVIFGMIIVVFVFWGVGAMLSGDRLNVAAMVDGEPISAQAFTRAHQNLVRLYRELYRDSFNSEVAAQLDLERRALDDLVTDLLLRREAARLGLQVSDDEVRESILSMPQFRTQDRFDRNRYLRALRASRVTPTEFEEAQRGTLLIGKLESLVTDGLDVSEAELQARYALQEEKIDLAFVRLRFADVADEVTVTDEDLGTYYEDNQALFQRPERIVLAYVGYAPEAFATDEAPSDEAVRAYHETHLDDFQAPEKARLRHIFFALAQDADATTHAEVRAKAEEVLAAIREGGDFAALAAEHSEDPETKDEGGEVGWVEAGSLAAALDTATFALEPGGVSEIVRGADGLYLLKVDEKRPAGPQPLDEVRASIERLLREQAADRAARSALEEDLARARTDASLADLAGARGLEVVTSPPVAARGVLAGVEGPDLLEAAFALEPGTVESLAGDAPPYFLFRVEEKTAAHVAPLDEVRDQVERYVREEKARTLARSRAEGLLEAARETGGLAGLKEAARAAGREVERTGPFGRADSIPSFGSVPIKDELFALTDEAPLADRLYPLPGGVALVALAEREVSDTTALTDEERDSLREATLFRKRQEILESYRTMLRQRADISVNPSVLTASGV